MRERFIDTNFKQASQTLILQCNTIIELYQGQGLRLSLRQLYYQLVSRNIIQNTERSYKNLGQLVSKGRLAGYIDWAAIEDRIRIPHKVTEWESPAEVMQAVINQYRLPRWNTQDDYVEVWSEKDALAGVLQPVVDEYHVLMMVNRGYSSQSAMKAAAERLQAQDKFITILYIGDQDPSGEDMVRDIEDRLRLLTRYQVDFTVLKVAITEEQIAQFNPPPNPAKMTDSRAAAYVQKFGTSSYEADALPPDVLATVVRDHIRGQIDFDAWNSMIEREDEDKRLLENASEQIMEERDYEIDDEDDVDSEDH